MRPIDADALQKAVTDLAPHPHDKWETIGVWHLIEHANTLTIDDLRPNGRWLNVRILTTGDGRMRIGDCSLCDSAEKLRRFCPNCGAKMETEVLDG